MNNKESKKALQRYFLFSFAVLISAEGALCAKPLWSSLPGGKEAGPWIEDYAFLDFWQGEGDLRPWPRFVICRVPGGKGSNT